MKMDQDDVTRAVGERYAAGAQAVEAELCCPVDYDARYLGVLPEEILERDYGCGDPSRHLLAGETVLDLGSGGGKICYIASQVVGEAGRVIGVDMTEDMLALARGHQAEVAKRIGWDNVEFRRGRIEDLRLDLDRLGAWLEANPVTDLAGYAALEAERERMRREEPMVADDSIDVIVSNCVLNLVAPGLKRQLFEETFRVLKRGGRAVISDIVADREVPQAMQEDPDLWSGCISGAFEEEAFLKAFEDAGFHGIEVLTRQAEPWQVVDGIEFRSMTVAAYKGKHGECLDEGQSVVYHGPFRQVLDDDGHLFVRGRREAVCAKTFELLGRAPYAGRFTRLEKDGIAVRDMDVMCAPEDQGGCC
jgi:arsenite methyltransferase